VDYQSEALRIRRGCSVRLRVAKGYLGGCRCRENSWSTGQVEGHINRLKMIERQMYGRAAFDLLRARVLPYSSLSAARSP